jgi:two-component system, chemotaxis family, chemotaxis protein CheY
MKILSADDSLIMRRVIAGAAGMLGYDLLEAKNGSEALALLKKNKDDIALILLDWNMPVMDGYEALRIIRGDTAYQGIPILMVTTESEKKSVVKAIQAGANNYLAKPFEKEELSKKMAECLALEAGS